MHVRVLDFLEAYLFSLWIEESFGELLLNDIILVVAILQCENVKIE